MTPALWIGGGVTVLLFILSHAAATIWWMSKINTTLGFVQSNVEIISRNLMAHQASSYTKEEAAKDFAVRDKEMAAMWKRIDTLNGGVHG